MLIQEFRVNRTASRISRGTTFDEFDFAAHLPHLPQHTVPEVIPEKQKKPIDNAFFQPLVMQFTVLVDVSLINLLFHKVVELNLICNFKIDSYRVSVLLRHFCPLFKLSTKWMV